VHARAAALFAIPVKSLFPQGVKIAINASAEAPNGHYDATPHSISLDIPPYPKSWVNKGTYAHELGHWLANSRHPQLNPAFRGSVGSHLLSETYADAVMMALTMTTEQLYDLPACLNLPAIDDKWTYTMGLGFIDGSFNPYRTYQCCQQTQATPQAQAVCDFKAETSGGEAPARPSAKPFTLRQYSAAFDDHYIGRPMLSFLMALGKKLGGNFYGQLLKAPAPAIAHRCTMTGVSNQVTVAGYRLSGQLNAIQGALTPAQRQVYQALWKAHAMDTAIAIDGRDFAPRVEQAGMKAFILAVPADHECKDILQSRGLQMENPDKCLVSCQQI